MADFVISVPDDVLARLTPIAEAKGLTVLELLGRILNSGIFMTFHDQKSGSVIDDFGDELPRPPLLPDIAQDAKSSHSVE